MHPPPAPKAFGVSCSFTGPAFEPADPVVFSFSRVFPRKRESTSLGAPCAAAHSLDLPDLD